jgi:hypothetical protein
MIFIASVLISLLFLVVERTLGIGWDFHLDAITYIESMEYYRFSGISSPFDLSNNLHYYIVSMLGGEIFTLLYNILLTALSSQIIYSTFRGRINGKLGFFLMLYLFNPYKMHLSVTLLKDSSIIFALVLSLFTNYKIIGILFGGLYRNAFLFYLIIHPKLKKYYLFFMCITVLIYLSSVGFTAGAFEEHISSDMTFRDFDMVPNFIQYGTGGAFLRALLWPVFVISGGYFIISPTLAYFPLFLGSFLLILILIQLKINLKNYFPFLILFSFFAIIVPGFTTYYRYIFPLLSVLPYILIFNLKLSKTVKLK